MTLGRPTTTINPGDKFQLLTAVAPAGKDKYKRLLWRCSCECGGTSVVMGTLLRTGRVGSCGCRQRSGHATHGHKRTSGASRAYHTWTNMKRRCNDPSLPGWKNYGGRGITYDPRWERFEAFLEDMGEPGEGLSLDRVDNNGNYEKSNCRWTTRAVQRANTRNTILVVVNGEELTLKSAAEKYGVVTYAAVLQRYHDGWTLIDALLTPRRQPNQR